MNRKILYLCHRIPYPPNKGDKIRSFNEIKYLSKNNTIDLITLADEPEDLKYTENLKKYCRQIKVFPLNKKKAKIKGIISLLSGKSITQGYFYEKQFQNRFNNWICSEQYDAVFCFSSPMAEYIFKSPNGIKGIAKKLIMDFCDLDSDKWSQYAQKTKFPLNRLYKTEASRLLLFEKKINKTFHRSIFVSEKEADLFKEYFPEAQRIQVAANGVDHAFFAPGKIKLLQNFPSPLIVFCGAMDYYANVDGVVWFAEKIFPLIKKVYPDIAFYIVGSNPDARLNALKKDPAIKITGFVSDIRQYYKTADVCVIPLRIARGVQNKVLEAMSMGKPIVTTSMAVQGISLENNNEVEIENRPRGFAGKVIDLLKNQNHSDEVAKRARNFILKHHNWNDNLKSII